MKFLYKPKSNLEKFANKIFNLLVENFSDTFYVGGMVRDVLLGKKITDIDIATSATPDQVASILKKTDVMFDDKAKKFGNIIAISGQTWVEITTFRKDLIGENRYHKVEFVKSSKLDAQRRDFTINALYLSPKNGEIKDFYNGLADLKNRRIKFIGNPVKRIKEDPLRIIRALRFASLLNFKLEKKSAAAIEKNFYLVNNLTKTKIEKEIAKLKNINKRETLKLMIDKQKILDKLLK